MRPHPPAAPGADLDVVSSEGAEAILPAARRLWIRRRRRGQQITAQRQLGGAMAVGEEADMTDPVEAIGHGVLEEAADELVGRKRHDLGLAILPVVFPSEADPAVVERDQTTVGRATRCV